ncbi:MAG: DUF4266 domain-containing protein [Flavobacteriales bacterium]|jgi:hypothetical protein|nr:DUF4266 domain-containing protein [Flavobacteriales bacterium]
MKLKPMITLLGFSLVLLSSSCVSVKEYQKMYLNDPDMQLSDGPIETFEQGFVTYREGVSGGNGGKIGGGCGCN